MCPPAPLHGVTTALALRPGGDVGLPPDEHPADGVGGRREIAVQRQLPDALARDAEALRDLRAGDELLGHRPTVAATGTGR